MIAQWIFVEGKMRALFGLLFGAGTVLLLERIERRAGPELAADVFHRRNMWLLFFGIIHGTLIWNGDILLYYGSFALLALYPLRNVRANRLVTIGLAMSRGGYLISEPENAKGEADFVSLVFRSGWCFEILGILIAGMGFYKTGFLSARLSSRFYLTTAVVGYAITGALVLIGLNHARRFGFSHAVTTEWIFLPYGVEQIAGMLANASILLLLVRHRILVPVQRGLAAVGRTALSNYLMTSLGCQFLFKWDPWKLYGKLEYYQDVYVVGCVWAINIIASLIWLRFFSF